jgi:hypothetical protein
VTINFSRRTRIHGVLIIIIIIITTTTTTTTITTTTPYAIRIYEKDFDVFNEPTFF